MALGKEPGNIDVFGHLFEVEVLGVELEFRTLFGFAGKWKVNYLSCE